MDKKYVKINIVDNDLDYRYKDKRIMDTFILVNPDMEKLEELQELLNNRHEQENEFSNNYLAVLEYIEKNFESLKILGPIEIEW
jgi:hypothetical protein